MNLTRKSEFYRLWHAGMLGNKPRVWHTLDALQKSSYRGELTIRSVANAGGATKYRVPYEEAVRLSFSWPCTCTFNESMPDEYLVLQGEVIRGVEGLWLGFDTTPGRKMNEARRFFQAAQGLEALCYLQYHLWPSSYDDLMMLLDMYQDHAIEFSSYRHAVGDQRNRNTIIWEVRAY